MSTKKLIVCALFSVLFRPGGARAQDRAPTFETLESVVGDAPPAAADHFALRSAHPVRARDLRSEGAVTAVRNQNPWGTCSVFATVAAMETVLKQRTGRAYDLSEEHLWSLYPWQGGDRVRNIYTGVKTAASHYVAQESDWAYDTDVEKPAAPAGVNARGIAAVTNYDASTLTSVSAAADYILAGHPVVLGFGVNVSLTYSAKVLVPGARKEYVGGYQAGHAVLLVGARVDPAYTGGGYFIAKNSWGPGSNDHGFFTMPFDYCRYDYCSFIGVGDVGWPGR